MNYHELTPEQKVVIKPVLAEIRKALYSENEATKVAAKSILKDGLVVNFGKGREERIVVKVKIV